MMLTTVKDELIDVEGIVDSDASVLKLLCETAPHLRIEVTLSRGERVCMALKDIAWGNIPNVTGKFGAILR